ncbi:ankyrin repeat domain-containing protein [Isoptericola sediminis]|uniref:Ankyrin repeat domain-containing protein n=1 Tax=Isoptericola sediminis TaxID=2733572 RepID=A0A849K3L7_9MICO|nr:ankyrin repeat domain-containing protein [Isoptericola sediminis]
MESLDEADRGGRTPLHSAALDGDVEEVRSLVAAGCDPGAADRSGFTPLHFAPQGDIRRRLAPRWTVVPRSIRGIGSATPH